MSDALLARYRLVRRIGAGGMAEVFRAELVGAEGVTRELVVKRMLHSLALDPEAVAMFVEEARIAARLRHPNVVQVYEFGKSGDSYFLAMELVEGCDLAAVIKHAGGQKLPLGAAAFVLFELLEGLAYVHELTDAKGSPHGLVHRDVSPHNVLLGFAGEVKLADFGIAQVGARIEAGTAEEGVRGKRAYMAPEQARGEPLDARADIFAAGLVLFELLTGRRAYEGRAEVLLEAAREGRVDALATVAPELHPALCEVADRALASERGARFQSAREFRDALRVAFELADVRPDREALRERMRATVEEGSRAATRPAADRTLTVQDPTGTGVTGTGTGAEPLLTGPIAAAAGSGERPRISPRVRLLFERFAIAVGVFVVAVLAERRTRPRETRAPTAPAEAVERRTVAVALPGGEDASAWFDQGGREVMERACRCRLDARRYRRASEVSAWLRDGRVDVAAVSSVEALVMARSGAVRRLEPLLKGADIGDDTRGVTSGAEGDGRYVVPVVADVAALAYRPEAVREATAGFTAARAGLEARLREVTGKGLPAGFALREDVSEWTTWDLLAAAWSWRSRAGAGRLWFPSRAGGDAVLAWTARAAATHGGSRVFGADEGSVLVAAWSAVHSATGVLHPGVREGEDGSRALGDARVAAAVVPASAVGRWGEGFVLAGVPRGDDVVLDGAGDPQHIGARVCTGIAWGWVVGRGSPQPGHAVRALVAGASRETAQVWSHATATLALRRDAQPPGEVSRRRVWDHQRAALDAGCGFLAVNPGASAEDLDARAERVRAVWELVTSGEFVPRVDVGALGAQARARLR